MIPRYTLPEMGALWSEAAKFQKWLDVEIAVCEVHAKQGTIPREALEEIKARASFTVGRIKPVPKSCCRRTTNRRRGLSCSNPGNADVKREVKLKTAWGSTSTPGGELKA